MALVKCPDCGKMVSPSAEQCPGCGRPMVKTRKANAFNPMHDPVHFLGLVIAIIMVLIFLFGLVSVLCRI